MHLTGPCGSVVFVCVYLVDVGLLLLACFHSCLFSIMINLFILLVVWNQRQIKAEFFVIIAVIGVVVVVVAGDMAQQLCAV